MSIAGWPPGSVEINAFLGSSRRKKTRFVLVWLAATVMLTGCAASLPVAEMPVSEPPRPKESRVAADIESALSCIRESGALRGRRFAIALHADGTGRTAQGFEGATGSFLPQGTSAIWATQAVMLAGGTAQNFYELNTERALRQFGGDAVAEVLQARQQAQMPDFIIATAFTALDFLAGPSVDLRVDGIGPAGIARGVSMEVSAEIYRAGDRTTLALSSVNRQVLYREIGFGVGRFFGGGAGRLVTGAASSADQQRLQVAARDAVALSTAGVLAMVPSVPEECRLAVDALLQRGEDAATAPADPAPDETAAIDVAPYGRATLANVFL